MSKVNIFTTEAPGEIPEEDIAFKFPYELDNFQKEGIYRIYKKENVLITAHTGSGKTVLAIYAIAECIRNGKKVIYTSPTKSLSNQKFAEFREKFDSVGILTGDIKMNPDAQCIIMTTEILRNMLYKNSSEIINTNSINLEISEIGAVIFDEVHYINDPDRGKVWEEVIVLLPREITLVMLSATIDRPESFASWVGNIKDKPINLIPTSHRVVPLKHYFWKGTQFQNEVGKDEMRWNLVEVMSENGKFQNYDVIKNKYKRYEINKLMDKLIDFLVEHNYTPALFFKFSRKKCEELCHMVRRNLLTHEETAEAENIFNHYMKDYKSTYEILPQYQDILCQIRKGAVYHHSGLIPILKEIIEILFSKGLVKVLFATETFAIGVNMPTKTVLFSELEKFTNGGMRALRTDEYLQMSGRAGRRGLDKFGTVILLPTNDLFSETEMRGLMTGKSPYIQSRFRLSYQFVLKSMLMDQDKLNQILENTLIKTEYAKEIQVLSNEAKEIEESISSIVIPLDKIERCRRYYEIVQKLGDRFFTLKNKDRQKLENEKKEIEFDKTFKNHYEKFKTYIHKKDNLKKNAEDISYCSNILNINIHKIKDILIEEDYIDPNDMKILPKGVIASCINDCQELLFTEMISRGYLDEMSFPEIVAILSAFINEKDGGSGEKYISDLNIPGKVRAVLNKMKNLGEYFISKEEKCGLYIQSDYNLYLDFVEPAYIWADGGTIQDIYNVTSVYDGNFVKAIMRLNNVCDNLKDICMTMKRYDLCEKMENSTSLLIRDITSINSLYVR